jgi:hypothetical protein
MMRWRDRSPTGLSSEGDGGLELNRNPDISHSDESANNVPHEGTRRREA